MGTVRGYRKLLRCGVVPPERPSPLRVCRSLGNNKLNGSVPSSLSALTKLNSLCVPLYHAAFALAADVGRLGRLCSERTACRGMHGGGIEGGRCGSRAVAVLSEGTSGTSCD